MKNSRWSLLLLMPCLSYGAASDQCNTAKVLTQIRPGAAWSMQADSMDKLKWLDMKQKMPSKAEVEKARQVCIADTKAREALKAQARLDVKNPTTPVEKKVDALILLLDMDR